MNNATLPLAVLSATASPKTSHRYVHVNSHEVVQRMADEGYYVASAKMSAPRTRDPLFAKHSIEFRHQDAQTIQGSTPRIIFVNSHDGSTSASAMAGLYRFVCSNGLVVGKTIDRVAQRHAGDAAVELIGRMNEMAKNTERAFSRIEAWSKIHLSSNQRRAFARLAAQLRWGSPELYPEDVILEPRREEDDKGDLWSVFNTVQENTVRGGLIGVSRSGRRATSRPLADIQRDVEYNSALWTMTDELAEAW